MIVKYKDRGDLVSFLLAHLNSLNYKLNVDGIFGPNTLKVLNLYLKDNNLEINKEIDTSIFRCNLKLKREHLNKDNTIGKLYINNEFVCYTLEDTDRGLKSDMSLELIKRIKIISETAIPRGTYKVAMNIVSPKYRRIMPRLLNVKGYSGVLIHSGNTEKDSAGCILVGELNKNKLINSRITFNKLFNRLINYSSINIEIV